MSDIIARDILEEHKISLLKSLDSIYCTDKNVISIWGADDMMGLTVVEKQVIDNIVKDVLSINLNVKLYLNRQGQIILTTFK